MNDPDLLLFRRRLGADLSAVRVHDDAAADRATREEHASGYTIGEHVVLGADADRAVLAHELVHVLQQRRAGRTAVQRQELPRRDGVGRVPPAVDFDVVRERAPSEDVPVLFANDSVSLAGLDLAPLVPRLSSARPLMVDIDGYASNEGDPEYNVNLSAHRAAAVRAVLLALLPEGSTVRLHAHGSTIAFGQDGAANRRVGIRVTAAPIALGPFTLQPPGNADQRDRFRLVPDLQLHLDPRLAPLPPGLLPPGVLPPLPDVRLPEVRLGDSLPGHRGPFGQDAPRAQGGPALDPRTPVGPWVGPWREGPFTPVPPPGPEPLQPPQLFPGDAGSAVSTGCARPSRTTARGPSTRFAASAQAFTEYWARTGTGPWAARGAGAAAGRTSVPDRRRTRAGTGGRHRGRPDRQRTAPAGSPIRSAAASTCSISCVASEGNEEARSLSPVDATPDLRTAGSVDLLDLLRRIRGNEEARSEPGQRTHRARRHRAVDAGRTPSVG